GVHEPPEAPQAWPHPADCLSVQSIHTPFMFRTRQTHFPLSEVLGGLSYALDLTEGQRPGHSVRTCRIGMRIADVLGLSSAERSSLFYALLMKDLGCSSNAARFAALFGTSDHDLKTDLKNIDWARPTAAFRFVLRNAMPAGSLLQQAWRVMAIMAKGPEGPRAVVRTRCERGAQIARTLDLDQDTVLAIRALDEHWDGRGQPYSLRRHDIPLGARILGLAQAFEVFFTTQGAAAAFEMASARKGTWFDPEVVQALRAVERETGFWQSLSGTGSLADLASCEPEDRRVAIDDYRLDRIAEAFAQVIDAKSPWTFSHSAGVAKGAVGIGRLLGHSEGSLRTLRRAALLHDVGKLGVSNLILDKPGKLTADELTAMRTHTRHTEAILGRVPCLRELVDEASAHHERLDGRGYHVGRRGSEVGPLARILAVADIFDALHASRPYRAALPLERVTEILRREAGEGLDPNCVEAMCRFAADEQEGPGHETAPVALVSALDEDFAQAA
ncbi:MAG: HD domain-containing phosphohydrolase, partial [Vicinamibacterales bacterium]